MHSAIFFGNQWRKKLETGVILLRFLILWISVKNIVSEVT